MRYDLSGSQRWDSSVILRLPMKTIGRVQANDRRRAGGGKAALARSRDRPSLR
jgi:hypothetical protein